MTNPPFSFLQFCDFHIGGARSPQKASLTTMVDHVRQVCATRRFPVSAVFLIGDLTFSGLPGEFESFGADFLQPLMAIPELANARVYAVPGNHDVDCDAGLPITWDGIQRRNQDIFFAEGPEGIKARKMRAPVFTEYWKFVEHHKIHSPNPAREVGIFESLPGWPIDILATNTAFFSDKAEESSQPITPAPMQSLRHLAPSATGTRPLLVLGHHPLTSYLPDHHTQFDTWLWDRKAVLLHGHEHSPKATFNSDGTLKTLGFGASYVTTLERTAAHPYVNCFAYCEMRERLQLWCYTWEPYPGKWIDNTALAFASCIQSGIASLAAIVSLPALSAQRGIVSVPRAIAQVPRASPRPSSLIPIGESNHELTIRLLALSDNLRALARREPQAKFVELPDVDGKRCLAVETSEGRHLLVMVQGVSHVLSQKEIESFNTRLDAEDFKSLTVFSFGKIAEDARTMYVRLKAKKRLEVLVNQNFTAAAEEILSTRQLAVMQRLEAGTHAVSVLVGKDEIYLLVLVLAAAQRNFYVLNGDGTMLLPSSPIVAALRTGNAEFERMNYEGEASAIGEPQPPCFDEGNFKEACFREYNIVRYAALANMGLKTEDLSLEDLYVAATAHEVNSGGDNRLTDLVSDYISAYPVSGELREHIQKQLLSSVDDRDHCKSSQAREFCQKYPSVLLTGDPGSGKTCFVKNEILAYCRPRLDIVSGESVSDWHAVHIPILVQLSELAGEADLEQGAMHVLASRLLSRRGFHFPAGDIERLLKQGRIAWFFDGLDEVVSIERRAAVVQLINQLVQNAVPRGNRLVVTSRPAAVQVVNLLPSLKKLEVQGLSNAEIQTLAARVLHMKLTTTLEGELIIHNGRNDRAGQLVRQLMHDCEQKPGVARLAQNPLLLTLLIVIYANAGAPAAKRHVIYKQAVETLTSVRGREAGHQVISLQDLRERLGAVAVSVYRKESGLLPTRREVCEVIRTAIQRQKGVEATTAEASAFVQRVAESTGLVVVQDAPNRSEDTALVTFMHHSFLEYFAAVGLSRDLEHLNISELVSQPRWHEILTLLAGILGDNEDIAPVLAKILGAVHETTVADAKLLLFAMDCALECDVPSEAAQALVCKAIAECITNGPAKLDPWIRSEIGHRAAQLFLACGGTEFDRIIANLLDHGDGDVCAAAIGVMAHAFASGYRSVELVRAFDRCCAHSDDAVLCAVATAAGRSPLLRTEPALQIIGRSLRKSSRRKAAAFEALGSIPALAVQHWSDVINGMDDKQKRTARLASVAAMQAGLNADVITLEGSRKDVLMRALRMFDESGNPEARGLLVKQETIKTMLGAVGRVDRLIGIQALPLSDADGQFVYATLMTIVRAKSDRQEVCAALHAIRLSPDALALFRQFDLQFVAGLLRDATADVRQAASRLLGNFGGDATAVEALLAADFKSMYAGEYSTCIWSLAQAKVQTANVTAKLYDEFDDLSGDRAKWTSENAARLRAVLGALRKIKVAGSVNLVTRIWALVEDSRVDLEIQKAAMLCYPAVTIPSELVVEHVGRWIRTPPTGLDLELVQVPSILADRCRESVDYVAATIKALIGLRKDLLDYYARVAHRRPVSDYTEFYATELRKGIGEVSDIVITFEELRHAHNGKKRGREDGANGEKL